MIAGALEPKRLELLRDIAPKATTVHILVNLNQAGVLQDIPTVAAAAGKLGLGPRSFRPALRAKSMQHSRRSPVSAPKPSWSRVTGYALGILRDFASCYTCAAETGAWFTSRLDPLGENGGVSGPALWAELSFSNGAFKVVVGCPSPAAR
jgi:hypothetical protein